MAPPPLQAGSAAPWPESVWVTAEERGALPEPVPVQLTPEQLILEPPPLPDSERRDRRLRSRADMGGRG